MRRVFIVATTLLALLAVPTVPAAAAPGPATATVTGPIGTRHVITCSVFAGRPWGGGGTIYGFGSFTCSSPPDIVIVCVQIEIDFYGVWEPQGVENCRFMSGSSGTLYASGPAMPGRWRYRTRAGLSAFHGNWMDAERTSATATITS
jgi:hypothetical protein